MMKKAIIIGLITPYQTIAKEEEYLNELELLAKTAHTKVYNRFIQKMEKPHPKTFVGSGKLNEISNYVKEHGIETLIFDDELLPSQFKNIEKQFACNIIDRPQLILNILAQRAKTYYARSQIQLAQYQYLLPRLRHMWSHLERQGGGIGVRGPGETEIETDRRRIYDNITRLKKKLFKIDQQISIQRKNRGNLIRVALVGYTNVGKSTIMNVLSKSNVFVENKLFATVDTTIRKVVIGNLPFLLADTVGFIRKLPTLLIKSFKCTLDEVREADILLHIIDISHESFEDHINSVYHTLIEIKAVEKPILMIFNKIDRSFSEWRQSYWCKSFQHAIFISSKSGEGFQHLKKILYKKVKKMYIKRFTNSKYKSILHLL